MSNIIDPRRESFFIIDTETMDVKDTAIVNDLSMVFVNMNGLFIEHYKADNYNPISFEEFYTNETYIKKFTEFPCIREQKENGSTISKETVDFWKKQYGEATEDSYKEYIMNILSTTDKISVKETVDKFESFVYNCLDLIPTNIQKRDAIPYLERSAGFDTNKYYGLLFQAYGRANHESAMKYWVRREYRTIVSCNRWRIEPTFLKEGTTSWSEGLRNSLEKEVQGLNFTKHVAINDCLIDAYMIYYLKMNIENFYI